MSQPATENIEADNLEAFLWALIEAFRAWGIDLPPPEEIEFDAIRRGNPDDTAATAILLAEMACQPQFLHS